MNGERVEVGQKIENNLRWNRHFWLLCLYRAINNMYCSPMHHWGVG